jgi:hypothetical protein
MHQAHARGKSSEATFSGSRQKGNARMATLLFQNPVSQLPGVIAWVAVKAGGKEHVLGGIKEYHSATTHGSSSNFGGA